MNKKTLKALKDSIEHWKRLYTGTTLTGEDTGVNDCPLCELFFYKGYIDKYGGSRAIYCSGCPIKKKTGLNLCNGSPYISSIEGKDSIVFKEKAKIFHDWLVELLPREIII